MRSLLITFSLLVCQACTNVSKKNLQELSGEKLIFSSSTSLFSSTNQNCDTLFARLNRTNSGNFGKVTHVPNDFEECLLQLDTLTNSQIREWIKCLPDEGFADHVHHGFGMYLRNNWGLWAGSTLSKNLYDMGMLHPDDMTAIIFTSYQRKLKGENIRLDEQLKYYQDFWRKNGMKVDSILDSKKKEKIN